MVYEGSTDIILSHETINLKNGVPADVLNLINDMVLVVTNEALGLYRNRNAIDDPLGAGRLDYVELEFPMLTEPEEEPPHSKTPVGHYVIEYQAGYIGLVSARVLLITPKNIQLFGDKQDALRNVNELAKLSMI